MGAPHFGVGSAPCVVIDYCHSRLAFDPARGVQRTEGRASLLALIVVSASSFRSPVAGNVCNEVRVGSRPLAQCAAGRHAPSRRDRPTEYARQRAGAERRPETTLNSASKAAPPAEHSKAPGRHLPIGGRGGRNLEQTNANIAIHSARTVVPTAPQH